MKLSETEYLYKIGEKEYRMKPLVMGQVRQLLSLLKGVEMPESVTVVSLITTLGDKLPEAVAILLIEPDKTLKNKNLKSLTEEIEFELTPTLTMEIIEDFFDCTPIFSILEEMGTRVEKIVTKMKPIGSTESPSS
ncbi:MAG TPA: hypothetical protein PKL88_02650 [bacterium]|jgi:hypothetical protein|nr:hypothetical protein [bacterium]